MNFGSFLVLLKLAMDSGFTVSPKTNGPTTPTVEYTEIRPKCAPGHYAYKDPLTGLWSCVPIPPGR
jgi:hypothetical protein